MPYSKLVEVAYRNTIRTYQRRLKRIWRGRRKLREQIERLKYRYQRYKVRGYKIRDIKFAIRYWDRSRIKGASRYVKFLKKILRRLERKRRIEKRRRPPKPKPPKPPVPPPPPPPPPVPKLPTFILIREQKRGLVNVDIFEREYGCYDFDTLRDIIKDCVENNFLRDGDIFYIVGAYLCFDLKSFIGIRAGDESAFLDFIDSVYNELVEIIQDGDVEGYIEFLNRYIDFLGYFNSNAYEFASGREEDIFNNFKRNVQISAEGKSPPCDYVLWVGFTIRIHQEKG